MIGQTIAHYKILEKIGAGGMGEVFLAEDTKLERKVALKFLPPHFSADPEFKSRFQHEAKATAALDHPNIVTIYELGEHDGRLFIAMQHVEGQTLAQKIATRSLTVSQALDITGQLCEGLASAHQAGIVHRDIKPANILIDLSGRVRILDFGLAKSHRATTETKIGSTLGTVQYESPEQSRGEEVDQRSDLFSVGVLLYEMITGKLPFSGDYDEAIRYSISHEEAHPLSRYASGISDDIQRLVSKALQKDVSLRYQTAKGVLSDLRNLDTVSQKPAGKRSAPIIKALAGAAVVATLVVYWFFLRPADDVGKPGADFSALPSVAVLYLENLSDDPEQEFFAAGMTEDIITDLSQISGLLVLSRHDVMPYRDREASIEDIGRELDVDYVMEGSVRRTNGQLRVTTQLIKVDDGFHVWAERFDRKLENVFAVQAEIAGAIAQALEVTLSLKERQSVSRIPTRNMAAYDLYTKGRHHYWLRSKKNNAIAEDYFREALALDENYALAYVGLGDVFTQRIDWGFDRDPNWIPEAKILLKRAAEIDSSLPELYAALSTLYSLSSEFQKAIEYSRIGTELRPTSPRAHYLLGVNLYYAGKLAEAELEWNRALELRPGYVEPYRWFSRMMSYTGNSEKAKEYGEKAIELAPRSVHILSQVGYVYFRLGEFETARDVLERGWKLNPESPLLLGALGKLNLFEGDLPHAIEFLSPRSTLTLGLAYRESGDELRAQETFRSSHRRAKNWIQSGLGGLGDTLALLLSEALLGLLATYSIDNLDFNSPSISFEGRIYTRYAAAKVLANRKEYEKALDHLSVAMESRAYSPRYVLADPFLSPLRGLPGFQALIEKYESLEP